jgi:hypothetical protein
LGNLLSSESSDFIGDASNTYLVSEYGGELASAIAAHIPSWTICKITQRAGVGHEVVGQRIGELVTEEVSVLLFDLLRADIDSQRQTPLALLRAHSYAITDFLHSIDAPIPTRDPFDKEAFPADVFDIGPTSWADFGEEVSNAALRWGAAKAMAHRKRHK